jgi:hypothetical protein
MAETTRTQELQWLTLALALGASASDGAMAHAQTAPGPAQAEQAAPAVTPAEAEAAPALAPESAALPGAAAPLPADPSAGEQAADDAAAAAGWGDLTTLSESEQDATPVFRAKLYGFIDSYWEKTGKTPESIGDDGETNYEANAHEFDVLNLHVMVQGALYEKYRFFVNLAAPGSGSTTEDGYVQVRNAWVEAPLWGRYINVRAGKTYRRFGLYNEILDAVPTFIGIEPPEIFDRDHLMVTRTTNLMLHGSSDAGTGVLNYSLTTGNDERQSGAFPVGGDLNIELPFGLKLGSSFYFTGGRASPSHGVGDGSPTGGVVNWVDRDKYRVLGGYAQLRRKGLVLQAEYWRGHHRGTRQAEAVQRMFDDGSLLASQVDRFFVDGDPARGVRTNANYKIDTGYFRGGYEFALGKLASITPYVQYDYYSNPETVKNKDLGGDNEAGATDDGRFSKYTLGGVFRPVPQVALKVDSSVHTYKYNAENVFYPEVRASFSYLWELVQ